MASPLPLPPFGTPFIDPATGAPNILWQNYLQALANSFDINAAPKDAQYWLSTTNPDLTNERNLGLLASGFVKIAVGAGVAVPSTVTIISLADGGTGSDLSATGGTSQVLKQTSAGGAVTVGQLAMSDIAGQGTTQTAYGAGTAYALTNAAAAIDFGTTDPGVTIAAAGTYLVWGQVLLAYNAATVATETATVKVRRTNNTAADISAAVVIDLPVATTLTHSYGVVPIPPVVYTTANNNDALALYGQVSATLGAGTIDATAVGTALVALRIL